MSIGEGLRTFLLADAQIEALISTGRPLPGIYPVMLPQNPTLPAITYFKVSGRRVHSSTQALRLSGPRIQIDCWALTYAAAHALAELVRKRIDAYRGAMGSQDVQGVFFETERDLYEPDPKQFRVSRDYFVWFEED